MPTALASGIGLCYNMEDMPEETKKRMVNVLSGFKGYMKRYFIDAMGMMAKGLFASLLIGTIFGTIGKYLGATYIDNAVVNTIGDGFLQMQKFCSAAAGPAIGVAIAMALQAKPFVVLSCAAVGYMSYNMGAVISAVSGEVSFTAGPAGAFFAVIIACEVARLVAGKTKVDILVTPFVTIAVGYLSSRLICPGVAWLMYFLGEGIGAATHLAPLTMGVINAVVVGIILTLPISSAAICASIFSSAAIAASANPDSLLLAGGAAAVGCCAQMVGFAAASFRENGWGGVVSQGLGTSMLQMGNICRRPQIWIPPTLAGAICGALSTTVFRLQCSGVSAGMGTCGLVGVLGVIQDSDLTTPRTWIGIVLLCIVLPAVLSLLFSELMRRFGWIRKDDMKLSPDKN